MAKYGALELINSSILNTKKLNILLGYIAVGNRRIWKASFYKNIVTIMDKRGNKLFDINTYGFETLRNQLICAYSDDAHDFSVKLIALPGYIVYAIAKDSENKDIIVQLYVDKVYGRYCKDEIYMDCHDIRGEIIEKIPQENVFVKYGDALVALNKGFSTLKDFKNYAKNNKKYSYECSFGYRFNDEVDMNRLEGLEDAKDVIGLSTKVYDISFEITEEDIKNNEFKAYGHTIGNFILGKKRKYLHHANSIRVDSIGFEDDAVLSINNNRLAMVSDSVKSAMFIEIIEQ